MSVLLPDNQDKVLAALYMYWGARAYMAMNKEASFRDCYLMGWVICTFYM